MIQDRNPRHTLRYYPLTTTVYVKFLNVSQSALLANRSLKEGSGSVDLKVTGRCPPTASFTRLILWYTVRLIALMTCQSSLLSNRSLWQGVRNRQYLIRLSTGNIWYQPSPLAREAPLWEPLCFGGEVNGFSSDGRRPWLPLLSWRTISCGWLEMHNRSGLRCNIPTNRHFQANGLKSNWRTKFAGDRFMNECSNGDNIDFFIN